jgi:hypothetical protein
VITGGSDRLPDTEPLNAEKRPVWTPLIVLAAFIAALVLIYLFGLTVLVPAD